MILNMNKKRNNIQRPDLWAINDADFILTLSTSLGLKDEPFIKQNFYT